MSITYHFVQIPQVLHPCNCRNLVSWFPSGYFFFFFWDISKWIHCGGLLLFWLNCLLNVSGFRNEINRKFLIFLDTPANSHVHQLLRNFLANVQDKLQCLKEKGPAFGGSFIFQRNFISHLLLRWDLQHCILQWIQCKLFFLSWAFSFCYLPRFSNLYFPSNFYIVEWKLSILFKLHCKFV